MFFRINKIIFAYCILCCQTIFAQTTVSTIDYTTNVLPKTSCNVFNVAAPYKVGGYTHFPVAGGAGYDGANIVLQSQNSNTSTSNLATAYAIAIPFKASYTYSFQFNAKGISGGGNNGTFPYINVSLFSTLPDPNITNPTACGAVAAGSWGGLQTNTLGGFYVSQNYANYNISNYTAPTSATSYLIILAYGGDSVINSTLISKIQITEVAPVSFTLPASVNISCGSVTPQVFTVTNVSGTTGVTGYTWNLGPNNGWLYNGVPAPSTILTGTTNTISLTPNCGSALSNISATVAVNGANVNTNTSTIVMTAPNSLAIVGGNTICSTPVTYLISGLPCGAIVTWSVGQTGSIVSSTLSGNAITLTQVTAGNISLTATVSNICGFAPIVLALYNIAVGIPVAGTYSAYTPGRTYGPYNLSSFNGPVTVASGSTQVSFAVTMPSPNTTYAWSQTSPTTGYNVTSPVLNFTVFIPPGSARFNLVATNACGTFSNSYFFPVNVGAFFAVAPTLASGSVTVTVNSGSSVNTSLNSLTAANSTLNTTHSNQTLLYAIKIVDLKGVLWKNVTYGAGVNSTKISLLGIPAGKYVVSGYDGISWNSQQIIIQ